MEFRQGIGLLGIVLAAVAAQLNDQVLSIALPDVAGGLGLSMDQAMWLRTLFVTGQVVGMCMAPSLGIAFSFRRFALFAIGMNLVPTLLMGLGGGAAPALILRLIQGLGSGFTIPLLMTVALRVLGPEVRLYGLAVYAMTATLTPNLATSFAALWVDGLRDFHWIFLETLPFCTLAAVCVWWGMEQEPPQLERLRRFDVAGVALVAAGFGSLTILLEQGDRFDWFNSPIITVLALVSVVGLPLLVIVERHAALPLMRFELLARRNFAYPVIVLIVFLVVSLSASQVPLSFLEQVRGLRPAQIHALSLAVAGSQVVLLPATAWLLDHRHVDARWVNAVGFVCILVACYLDAHVTSAWGPQQFVVGEGFQALGFAFVVMPLLMIATNTIKPDEGPYGSALVNTPRAVAEAIGVWAIALIARWRGGLHRVRLVDLLGQNRRILGQLHVLPPDGREQGARTAYAALDRELERQVVTLTTIDTYAIMGMLTIGLMIALALIPTRTYPPRIALAQQ